MKNTFFTLTTWFATDPRRVAALIMVVMLLAALSAAVLPSGVALAGEITSGS